MGLFDSLFGSSSSSTTNQSATRNPWAPATGTLTGILGQVNQGLNNTGLTGAETNSLNSLENNSNAWSGQYAPQIGQTTTAEVYADTDAVLQVLSNLIENGIKYGQARGAPHCRVVVSAEVVQEPVPSVEVMP